MKLYLSTLVVICVLAISSYASATYVMDYMNFCTSEQGDGSGSTCLYWEECDSFVATDWECASSGAGACDVFVVCDHTNGAHAYQIEGRLLNTDTPTDWNIYYWDKDVDSFSTYCDEEEKVLYGYRCFEHGDINYPSPYYWDYDVYDPVMEWWFKYVSGMFTIYIRKELHIGDYVECESL